MIPQVKRDGGTGAVLQFIPPLGPCVPGAGTVSIYKTTDGTASSTGLTASICSLNVNASNSPAAKTTSITVANTSGAAQGDRIWVGSRTAGPLEPAQILQVVNSTTLTLVEGLRYAHTTPGIRGQCLELPLNGRDCLATAGTYRSEWSWLYEGGGPTYYGTQLFEVVVRVFQLPLAPRDLQTRIPLSLRRAAKEVLDADLLSWAERHVVHDLRARMMKPQHVVDQAQFDRVGVAAAEILLATRWASVAPAEGSIALEAAEARYDEAWRQLQRERLTWYDGDGDDTLDSAEHAMSGRRYIWLEGVGA
mgnify:CR=1 FL=1